MAKATLPQLRSRHDAAVEANRNLGVIEYETREPLSDRVFEVTEGYKHVGTKRLGPGHRFRPTKRQVANNVLEGKARELNGSEYAGIQRHDRRPQSTGADIGLRSLSFTNHALTLALDAGLTEHDFAGIEPDGEKYTKAQVEEIIATRPDHAA